MCGTITHPEYNEYTRKNDIAILRLCKYVNFNEKTKLSPACLPSSEDNNYENVMVSMTALSCAEYHWEYLLLRPQCPHGQVSHQVAKRRWKWTLWPMIRWGERKLSWFLIWFSSIDYRFIFQCTDITNTGGITADMLCAGGYDSQHQTFTNPF